MSNTVTLKHTVHTLPKRFEPVYDGAYWSHNGLVTLPVENVNHIRALWFRGYQQTPEGQSLRNFQELDAYIAEVAAQEDAPQTAMSQGETTNESDDTGRQSVPTDGLREGESDSSGQTASGRTRRRRSSRTSRREAEGTNED